MFLILNNTIISTIIFDICIFWKFYGRKVGFQDMGDFQVLSEKDCIVIEILRDVVFKIFFLDFAF